MSTDSDIWGLWPEAHDRIFLDEVGSTMEEAEALAPTLRRPTWVIAALQTKGRGRQGRHWQEEARGNLAATLIYRPEATPADAARRSFMAANAVFEALALHVDRTRLAKKWPNDILLDGGKVAGILLESAGSGADVPVDWLAIGIGVNLAHAPRLDGVDFAPVSLIGQGGPKLDPRMLASEIATNIATEERLLAELGFGRIRRDWLRHAARLGERITARTVRGEVTGTFDSIDEGGNLVLITAAGPQLIPAGEVFF